MLTVHLELGWPTIRANLFHHSCTQCWHNLNNNKKIFKSFTQSDPILSGKENRTLTCQNVPIMERTTEKELFQDLTNWNIHLNVHSRKFRNQKTSPSFLNLVGKAWSTIRTSACYAQIDSTNFDGEIIKQCNQDTWRTIISRSRKQNMAKRHWKYSRGFRIHTYHSIFGLHFLENKVEHSKT